MTGKLFDYSLTRAAQSGVKEMLLRSAVDPVIGGVFAIGAGAFSVICAAADFDWFMNNRKAAFFVAMFGRNGARVFYVVLGLGLIGLGVGLSAGLLS